MLKNFPFIGSTRSVKIRPGLARVDPSRKRVFRRGMRRKMAGKGRGVSLLRRVDTTRLDRRFNPPPAPLFAFHPPPDRPLFASLHHLPPVSRRFPDSPTPSFRFPPLFLPPPVFPAASSPSHPPPLHLSAALCKVPWRGLPQHFPSPHTHSDQ